MLILRRAVGERVVLECGGEVVVIEVLTPRDAAGVRLGITAAATVAVDREEIADAKRREREGGPR